MASIIYQQYLNTISNAHAKFQPNRLVSLAATSLLHLFTQLTSCEFHMDVTHHNSPLGMA